MTPQYLRHARGGAVHPTDLEVPQQRPWAQHGPSDCLGEDDRDFHSGHHVGLVRLAPFPGQQNREAVLLGLVDPFVVGVSGHDGHTQ